ncbi:guanylate cyclase [bacterium]|nr:guanylate cyclase [bacterium]
MNALIRLARSAPLIIALAVAAFALYVIVAAVRSPDRAKELLIRVFGVVTILLSMFFMLGIVYAWADGNAFVMDLSGGFAIVSIAALGIVLVCRWRFLRHRPDFYKPGERERLPWWRLL